MTRKELSEAIMLSETGFLNLADVLLLPASKVLSILEDNSLTREEEVEIENRERKWKEWFSKENELK